MIANTGRREFAVVEITNEMPVNRIGGVGSVIEGLLSGFRGLGADVLWFVVDHRYRPFEIEAILAGFDNVAVGAYEDLRRFDAAVVHLHSYFAHPDLLGHLGDVRSLFTVHSLLAFEETSNDVDLGDMVRGQEALIAACDEVALVSRAERRYYRELGYEALNDRVSVVHNGAPLPPAWRDGRGREVIGYCGRLVPRKRPEFVQQVLLEPGFESARTLIAGKAFSRFARDLVVRLGIETRVRYLGWCGGERLEAFYEAIDVLALPSSYEPFGLSVVEAALRGVPVVCTRIDGLTEILGEHAFYSADASYDAFVAAMRRWREADPEALAAQVAGARERCLERFTDRAMAARYLDRFAGPVA